MTDIQLRLIVIVLKTIVVAMSTAMPTLLYARKHILDENLIIDRTRWEEYFYKFIAKEEEEGSSYADDLYDIIAEIVANPITINSATREDFKQIPFLEPIQIEAIFSYLETYGPVRSLGELDNITLLNNEEKDLLQYLLYIDEVDGEYNVPGMKQLLKYGRSTLFADIKLPFYDRAGDINGYNGYKYKHWFRYDFQSTVWEEEHLRIGFVGSQDAGEPFFSGKNIYGYDFYSFYFQIKKWGRFKKYGLKKWLGVIENVVLGRYRLCFGMGLMIGNGFKVSSSKSSLSTLERGFMPIHPFTSRSEDGYFQGFATTLRIIEPVTATAFFSYRGIDATLNSDGSISSIVTSGYHRTPVEMSKKYNTHALSMGGNVTYNYSRGIHCGISAIYTCLDRSLNPNTNVLYRRYYASGKEFFNASLNYGWNHPNFSLRGETAIDGEGDVATINGGTLRVNDGLSFTALYRYYNKAYNSLYSNGFSDGSVIRNEEGFYLGSRWRIYKTFILNAYIDYAHFPCAKYLVSFPSRSFDNMLTLSYAPLNWKLSFRYRVRFRQRDNSDKTALIPNDIHRVRFCASCNDDFPFGFRLQADYSFSWYKTASRGYMFSAGLHYKYRSLSLDLSSSWFHTDSYASRIYIYERGVRNTFSYPSYYGRGIRCALLARLRRGYRFMLSAKLGVTSYFDRSTISSGLQMIDSSSMTDLEIQAMFKF